MMGGSATRGMRTLGGCAEALKPPLASISAARGMMATRDMALGQGYLPGLRCVRAPTFGRATTGPPCDARHERTPKSSGEPHDDARRWWKAQRGKDRGKHGLVRADLSWHEEEDSAHRLGCGVDSATHGRAATQRRTGPAPTRAR